MPFIFSEQRRDRTHRHVDIVGTTPIRECFQLAQNILRVLLHQGRHSRTIGNRTMAALARRNATLTVSKRNQMRCDRRMTWTGARIQENSGCPVGR